mmetsp:Transcript_48464/g.135392  ORF Transcript_48464/g.135392 Transcript_48464/m.135392 type:complete len:387 (+) Transcript_48464:62-1222(+)
MVRLSWDRVAPLAAVASVATIICLAMWRVSQQGRSVMSTVAWVGFAHRMVGVTIEQATRPVPAAPAATGPLLAAEVLAETARAIPVFYTISTPRRALPFRRWLDAGGSAWCHIRLPTLHPEDFKVFRGGPNASIYFSRRHEAGRPFLAMHPPFKSTLLEVLEKPHKVASAYFHLKAVECIATRCHPCLAGQDFAAIFEDDVAFLTGRSPGGSAAAFPDVILEVLAQLRSNHSQTNKLQLAVERRNPLIPCRNPPCHCRQRDWAEPRWPTARLWDCRKFYDCKAYVLFRGQAQRVVEAHSRLMSGSLDCVNPWLHATCGLDPLLVNAFLGQCRTPGSSCRGLALGSVNVPYALKDNGSHTMYRKDVRDALDGKRGIEAFLRRALQRR